MVNYPPYVDSYGQLKNLFTKIIEAKVPPKFTQDFLSTKLGLKSSSYRPMIPFIKKLGFIDQSNVPTSYYRNYRDNKKSKIIMAERIRTAYKDLYAANEYAHTLTKEDVISKLNTVLGTSSDDNVTPRVAATFLALVKLADFEGKIKIKEGEGDETENGEDYSEEPPKLGLSYTINLNLPATTDVEVFNAIFKALKENLL